MSSCLISLSLVNYYLSIYIDIGQSYIESYANRTGACLLVKSELRIKEKRYDDMTIT